MPTNIAALAAVRRSIAATLRSAPIGGTDRERQAWRNGVRELAEDIAEQLGENPSFFDDTLAVRSHKPIYEDGLNSDHGSYMDEAVPPCEYCGKTGTRREAIEHIQNPCEGLLANQKAGEELILSINRQMEADPEPF